MTSDFAEAYEDSLPRVYAFFAYRTGSREDAEDLTQATFERALRHWRRYDPRRASPATWLLAIARNLLIDHARSAKARPSTVAWDTGAEEATETDPIGALGPDPDLLAALAQLTPRDREIVALRFGADLTGPEIAALTDLTLANVQQIVSRSLRRLRELLEQPDQAANGPTPSGPRPATSRSADPIRP